MYSVFGNVVEGYRVSWNKDTTQSIPYHSKKEDYMSSSREDDNYKFFWESTLFDEWVFFYSNSKRKAIKRMNTLGNNPEVIDTGWINPAPGVTYRQVQIRSQNTAQITTSPIKEDTMNNTETMEKYQRDFLARDVDRSHTQHTQKLQKHFHLTEDHPKSIEEAVERIEKKQFKLQDKNDRSMYDNYWSHIQWRTEDKDQKGYNEAVEKLDAEYRHVRQDIMVDDLAKAKKSVRDFEKTTFH